MQSATRLKETNPLKKMMTPFGSLTAALPDYITPREDLVVAMLEISLLLSPDGVHQLVLVEIENLVQAGKVGSQGNELTQVQNTAAEEDFVTVVWR
jgi:hypothetical protein